ncbi:MAG: glutathione synthase/RimK-type ligase-like ATP-grasp enzyme [Flavobacteriales bacterium]|jgi:glutathione synthase/RimK-type ligase-like ATP-grasp enzyme
MKFDVTLLTESRYLNPSNPDWYAEQILTEDRILQKALERKGLSVRRCDWADRSINWSETSVVLFRTTWDYFHRFKEFSVWLEQVSTQTTLINPAELIHWNINKRYFEDLEVRGVNCVETVYIKSSSTQTLRSICEATEWTKWVLKPTVSGAGRHTYLITSEELDAHEELFQSLVSEEEMMIQPFIQSVVDFGELSLMVMNGQYTHAVHKTPKKGDFRVQDDFGGTVKMFEPTQAEIKFAERAVQACTPKPMYARVDMVKDNAGQLAIAELELIEPELWFRFNEKAADVLAEGIAKKLTAIN